MKNLTLWVLLLSHTVIMGQSTATQKPFRIGIAGLAHGHVHWILRAVSRGDLELAGISETNRELAHRYLKQYNIPEHLLYSSLEEMLEKGKPEGVTAFGSIYDHLAVVKACAPRKVHVMVEKPLAANLDHARQIEALARKHQIHVLTNYETTWYGSNYRAFSMFHDDRMFGDIRKIVVHDGHFGPKEIGVNKEFLEWLTDPVLNGGGALMDFGCYGADLITWLMKGEKPVSVSAVTQTIKPDIYTRVDDEATIILTYPKTQGIIQASWNWPYHRKDMEVYGQTGYVIADKEGIRFLQQNVKGEKTEKVAPPEKPLDDPFSYFAGVVRGSIPLSDQDLSSIPVNMTAMEILDAATRSAKSGKTVYLEKKQDKK